MTLLHIAGQYWLDWHLHPEVVLPLILLEVAYLYSVTEVRGMISDAGRVKRSQVLTFSLGVLVPILVVLSALKFSLVVMWFMHLRFDSRLFSTFFVGGLILVAALFVVVLATLGGALV